MKVDEIGSVIIFIKLILHNLEIYYHIMVFTKSSSSKSPTKRLNQPRGRSSGW